MSTCDTQQDSETITTIPSDNAVSQPSIEIDANSSDAEIQEMKVPTTKEIVYKISQEINLPMNLVSLILDSYSNIVYDVLLQHNEAPLLSFGKLRVLYQAERPSRNGRNPKTGQSLIIGQKPSKYKIGAKIKKSVQAKFNKSFKDKLSVGLDSLP